jgi:hypothetical protein
MECMKESVNLEWVSESINLKLNEGSESTSLKWNEWVSLPISFGIEGSDAANLK